MQVIFVQFTHKMLKKIYEPEKNKQESSYRYLLKINYIYTSYVVLIFIAKKYISIY